MGLKQHLDPIDFHCMAKKTLIHFFKTSCPAYIHTLLFFFFFALFFKCKSLCRKHVRHVRMWKTWDEKINSDCFLPPKMHRDELREKELASGLSGLECVEFILDELILTPPIPPPPAWSRCASLIRPLILQADFYLKEGLRESGRTERSVWPKAVWLCLCGKMLCLGCGGPLCGLKPLLHLPSHTLTIKVNNKK